MLFSKLPMDMPCCEAKIKSVLQKYLQSPFSIKAGETTVRMSHGGHAKWGLSDTVSG